MQEAKKEQEVEQETEKDQEQEEITQDEKDDFYLSQLKQLTPITFIDKKTKEEVNLVPIKIKTIKLERNKIKISDPKLSLLDVLEKKLRNFLE